MAILFDWYENPKTSEQQGEENMAGRCIWTASAFSVPIW